MHAYQDQTGEPRHEQHGEAFTQTVQDWLRTEGDLDDFIFYDEPCAGCSER